MIMKRNPFVHKPLIYWYLQVLRKHTFVLVICEKLLRHCYHHEKANTLTIFLNLGMERKASYMDKKPLRIGL